MRVRIDVAGNGRDPRGAIVAGQRGKEPTNGEAVVERLATDKVRWVQLFYTDVFGGLNQLDMPRHALDAEMFRTGVPKLDGSSVRGFREIFESDMLLVPDPRTMANIPWSPEVGRTVRFICDVRLGGTSEPYDHDPRGVARKTEKVLADAGFDKSYWGPEIEFFVFDRVELIPSFAGVRDAWAGAGYLIGQSEAPWDPASAQPTIRFKEGYHRTPADRFAASRCGPRCATSWPTTSTSSWTRTTTRSRPPASRS